MLFEKGKYLARTYKSSDLSYKLPKRTMYIREHFQQVRQIFVLFGQSTVTFTFCLATFLIFIFSFSIHSQQLYFSTKSITSTIFFAILSQEL